jgi:hypothetical protein
MKLNLAGAKTARTSPPATKGVDPSLDVMYSSLFHHHDIFHSTDLER